MTTSATGGSAGALCSEQSAQRGLPLIGSAGCYDAVLAFELPPPWTPRLAGSRASDATLDAAMAAVAGADRKIRLLALEPESAAGNTARVLWLERAAGTFTRYTRREYMVGRPALAETLERLAAGENPSTAPIDTPGDLRDILVCTHGARDACCGKFGYPLYVELRRLAAMQRDGAVRVWRTSHLGGHRFAPTLVDLPSGRMFGRMSVADAGAVLSGGQTLHAKLASIYRGRCVLPEPAQVVERDLWIASGPGFEAAALSWTVEAASHDAGDADAAFDVAAGAAGTAGWIVEIFAKAGVNGDSCEWSSRARVRRDDACSITTPSSCGRDPEVEVPWRVVASGR